MKVIKRIGKVLLILVSMLLTLILGLIINNRIMYMKYLDVDTGLNQLTQKEKEDVEEIYAYLSENGNGMVQGFDGSDTDLILYNEKYEFLFSVIEETIGWEYIGWDEGTQRYLYRRPSQNPQAFAVKVGNRWVGSFSTHDYYNQSILEQVPIVIPPQLLNADREYYMAIVIHEMAHAFQGSLDFERLDKDEHLNNIAKEYEGKQAYQEGIAKEAEYLSLAMHSEDREAIIKNLQLFLDARNERRNLIGMTTADIQREQEFEWLEGMGRYTEYLSSRESSCTMAKGLGNIVEKCKVSGDDKYYTLGMVQYICINMLSDEWEKPVLQQGVNLEDFLRNLW